MTRRYIPATKLPDLAPSVSIDEEDIASLLENTLEILRREVRSLMAESGKGKLSKGSSTDLVNYVKLLNELHTKEKDLLSDFSDEDLEALIKDRNAKAKSTSGS